MRIARRTASVPASLAAGLLLALAAATAYAAQGTLVINDVEYENPRGCILLEGDADEIVNGTDGTTYLHQQANCTGRVLEVVEPGNETFNDRAYSLWIG